MARRRPADEPGHSPMGMPENLRRGPCIETWTAPGEQPPRHRLPGPDGMWRGSVAQSRWWAAVREWAAEHGVPARQARGMTRTQTPWSREFLLAQGRGELVESFEGRRQDHPGD